KINQQTVDRLWGNTVVVIYHAFNPNQFAAFPSLHAAFPALAAVYAWRRYRALAIGLVVWTLAVVVAIVYLGEHYVVDALAAFVYVAVAAFIVESFTRWRRRRAGDAGPIGAAENLDERFGDPGGPDPGEAASSAASASVDA
ncbi:MAG: phosphatase PAP2 family protein, partial [Terriglobales bacterium]